MADPAAIPPAGGEARGPDPWDELAGRPDPGPAFARAAERDWPGYFRAVAGKPPRETTLQALDLFDAPGFAIDLGCGEGRDAAAMLARGWRVLALDGHEMAVELTAHNPAIPKATADRLEVRLAAMEAAELPACDLLNASFALPFCEPAAFPDLWARIVAAIRSGGVFAGQLFGDRDTWAALPDRTHLTRTAALACFDGFDLVRFDEEERDGEDAGGQAKHWHVFHVVARKG
ncbi:MAG: class I SAM-dependent methyltransferase [Planctomycetota bacterium]